MEGVVEGSVLSQFEMLLRNVFVPVLQQKADWGELDSNETVVSVDSQKEEECWVAICSLFFSFHPALVVF